MSKKRNMAKRLNTHIDLHSECVDNSQSDDILDIYRCNKCGKYAWIYMLYDRVIRCPLCRGSFEKLPPIKECLKKYRRCFLEDSLKVKTSGGVDDNLFRIYRGGFNPG